MRVQRFDENPLITPMDVAPSSKEFEVICAFNPGAIQFEGETLLLIRVAERPVGSDEKIIRAPVLRFDDHTPALDIKEFDRNDPLVDSSDSRLVVTAEHTYLTSISHLRLARSEDGINFTVDEHPTIVPDRPAEAYGIEDCRISCIDGIYYIVYKSVSPQGICGSVATTRDFINFEKQGIILPPENMDSLMFPEKIRGKYVALHRPFPHLIGAPSMWICFSEDGTHWGDHRYLAGALPGGWESGRIGGSAVPIKTDRGWLEIYHGATADNRYSLGAMLLDLDDPARVIARSSGPIMEPEADYELHGFVPNVVFTCGAVADGDRLTIYYGAADTVVAGAEMSLSEILDGLAD